MLFTCHKALFLTRQFLQPYLGEMPVNYSLRYGFQYEQYLNSIGWAINVQCYVPVINLFLIHPVMIFVLYSNRPSMSRGIFWGYILTEIGVILFDVCTFFVRIYFIAPFAAIYCEGPICRMGLQKSIIMTILSIAIVTNIPCFIFLLVRMHQAITADLNPRWKFKEWFYRLLFFNNWSIQILSTQYALFAFVSVAVGLNVPGFALFAKESDDSLELYKQPELEWLLSRGGTIFLFGDYGKPQYFIYELYVLGVTLITVAPPVVFFFVQSMHSLRLTKKIALSTKTQAMAQRMFQVFLWQMTGAFFCMIMPVSLLFIFIMFDLRWFVPDAPSTFLRFICLTLKLITETMVRKLFGRTSFSMSSFVASSGYTTSQAAT
ncbi:hypothetical protein PRIPAC_77667 [Pristionchus pacificus]|uniref:G protein-coupled receptor n=1 Tax=Pristionchus pacificus TaxID=54126 RepID=A0A2A6CNH7_PRIPA|nr:hypothetical protein PRIPAC_77667 [Pristionchus pacificus]|eukprot:PDM79775.1 G protein-coupled receptor [Pristionchus pacificus]